jgi:hypothetical protein
MYKFIELRFLPKLKHYLVHRLDQNQTGFVPGCGTSVNIQLLIEMMKDQKKVAGECAVFIDFKSAYNTINRKKLYQIIRQKGILDELEAQFLEKLHDNLYFKVDDKKVSFANGVHQGSPLSPALFDIYMEEVLRVLKERCIDFWFWYKVYADDLVLITNYTKVDRLVETLVRLSQEYDLKINTKKSAVLLIKDHEKQETEVCGIKLEQKYKYLGVHIDNRGSMAPHL